MSENEKIEKPQQNTPDAKALNIMELPNVQCECGNGVWEFGFIIKRLDTEKTGPKNIPIDVITCKKCNSILQDGVPLLRPSEQAVKKQ